MSCNTLFQSSSHQTKQKQKNSSFSVRQLVSACKSADTNKTRHAHNVNPQKSTSKPKEPISTLKSK